MKNKDNILKILIQKRIIQPEQLLSLTKEAKSRNINIEEVIVKNGILDEEGIVKVRAEVRGFPYQDLTRKKIKREILEKFSKTVAENYKIICFDVSGSKIKVGIVNPDNFKAIEAVDYLAKEGGLQVEYFLISKKSFSKAYKQYTPFSSEVHAALDKKKEEKEEVQKKSEDDFDGKITKSAPVVRIVSIIIRHAIDGVASDIHIEPLQKETRVRYRIDGILHTSLVLPRSIHDAIIARIKVMANLKLDETRIPQDGRIRLVINKKEYDFRVSILPLVGSEKVVMRILDTSKGAPKLKDLGYEGEQYDLILKAMKLTDGLILITGPTGSGKSTTLFSVLNIVNKEGVNVATLEDPVEYQMKGVNQSQIKPEIGYTFAAGLRSFLRQDPDIIMVGEIRDQETGELAIHAALTGHLVFSTLHTLDSIGSIARMMDMGIESFLLGSTLQIVIAQRLTRRICEHCKIETKIPNEYMKKILTELDDIGEEYIKTVFDEYDRNNIKFYKGKGCSRCGNSGYAGRLAISEVLDTTGGFKDLILEGEKNISVEEVRKFQRFISIQQDGIIKVIKGMTTIDEVLRVIKD